LAAIALTEVSNLYTTPEHQADPIVSEPVEALYEDPADNIEPLDEMERKAIMKALAATGGNRTRAADHLKISIRTLRNKLLEYREAGLLAGTEFENPGD
jgi:DNA-binding NtrC family response regulator